MLVTVKLRLLDEIGKYCTFDLVLYVRVNTVRSNYVYWYNKLYASPSWRWKIAIQLFLNTDHFLLILCYSSSSLFLLYFLFSVFYFLLFFYFLFFIFYFCFHFVLSGRDMGVDVMILPKLAAEEDPGKYG